MLKKHLPEKTSGGEIPAKEVFQQRAMNNLQVKLSDCFSMAKEKEVNTEFMAEDGTNVKVFGFRARKGLILGREACIEINGLGGEDGGNAIMHLHKNFFMKLANRGGFYKLHYYDRGNLVKPEAKDLLKERGEFKNFLSVLDFLKSQNISSLVLMARASEEEYLNEIRERYNLALQVKTLEKSLKPQEAVQKVCEECKSPTNVLNQLDDHKMDEEAMILRRIIASKAYPADPDSLLFTWSCRPPANAGEIVIALGGSKLQDVKKFIEKAIAEKEADVKKKTAEAQQAKKEINSAVNAAWETYLRDDFSIKRRALMEETNHLNNLRKAHEMLCSYKPT